MGNGLAMMMRRIFSCPSQCLPVLRTFLTKNVNNESLKDLDALQAFKMMLVYVESDFLNLF